MIKILPIVICLQLILLIKRAPYGFGYLTLNDGFHYKFLHAEGPCLFLCDCFTESRAKDDWYVGAYAHELLGKFAACHIRHGHVGDHKVKIVGPGPKEFQGIQAACPPYNFISQTAQYTRCELNKSCLIIHK